MLADMVAMPSSVRFYAWSLKTMLMVGDHVSFIPRRIQLSICERNITLPVGERADDSGSAADLPVEPLDRAHDVLGDAPHELPQVHRPVLEPRHRQLLPHAFR